MPITHTGPRRNPPLKLPGTTRTDHQSASRSHSGCVKRAINLGVSPTARVSAAQNSINDLKIIPLLNAAIASRSLDHPALTICPSELVGLRYLLIHDFSYTSCLLEAIILPILQLTVVNILNMPFSGLLFVSDEHYSDLGAG